MRSTSEHYEAGAWSAIARIAKTNKALAIKTAQQLELDESNCYPGDWAILVRAFNGTKALIRALYEDDQDAAKFRLDA